MTTSVEKQTPAYPPVAVITDTISWIQHVDWKEQRERARAGVNNVGLVIAVIGEKCHDLGIWLASI